MVAVGIDISKSKSTVAILDSYGTVLAMPFDIWHTQQGMQPLLDKLKKFSEPVTILMEHTGHYHHPVLKKLQEEGYPVCVVNPYGGNSSCPSKFWYYGKISFYLHLKNRIKKVPEPLRL